MPDNSYKSVVEWLFSQFPSYQLIGSSAYKPTLQNIQSICELIGNPQNDLKFIHIAGTNGKGSCSAMLSSILTESGQKTGLFTSPHIRDFRERIRIDGQMISEEEVVDFVMRIRSLQLNFEPSFFEITFAMALEHFKRNDCSICVIETGLGGRLDATNIITPIVSLITNISLEHTAILGDTLEQIAFEKAGIIKKGVPVVIGETLPETKSVFETKAKEQNTPIFFAEETQIDTKVEGFKIPLLGTYQINNFRNVLTVLDKITEETGKIDRSIIQQGLDNISLNTGFFGRMQIMQTSPLLIYDVSHNLEGIRLTLETIKQINKGQLYILYGSSADKDVLPILHLFPESAKMMLTSFNNQRSLNKSQLQDLSKKASIEAEFFSDPKIALEEIKKKALDRDTILVIGSFFLLSDLI